MADPCSCLVATSPVGPVEPVGGGVIGLGDECGEQSLDLVASERDQSVRGGVPGVLIGQRTTRKAWASIARVTQRDQEVKRRT